MTLGFGFLFIVFPSIFPSIVGVDPLWDLPIYFSRPFREKIPQQNLGAMA